MATSPSSSAVSAAADVWTSRSGEPHRHGRGERTGHLPHNQPRKAGRPCPRPRATTTTARSTPRSSAPARRTSATSACPATGWRSLVDRAAEEHFALLRYNMGPGRVLARRLEPRRPPRAAGSRRAARRPPGQTGQGTPAAGRGAISTRRTDGYRFEMLRLRAEPAFVRPADGIPVPSVNVRCRTSNPIPASSQQPGSNAGFPQTYGSQSIVSLRSCRHVRCVAAQRTSGLAQAVYQHGRRLAEIDRRRSGWTVNPSAYAYRGSNAAAGLDIWATYR